ncbi:uncharacterized protein IUM83_03067 [Phytophthora cinnamomi]|uniref:uncharacterized protein n=1 Tax=Phytophthora cinnamomi TaxID=4785 RepID=UPI00355A8DD4|nr:hypothetical protein IUM83_03067 [Phytophthora cinnamomi]
MLKMSPREYCKSKVSETEHYYPMAQRKDEKALTFLYRLNIAAERADVDFREFSKQHVRQFIRRIKGYQLKSTLEGHRFKKVADLEYILKCREELHAGDDAPSRSTATRDFRVGNLPHDRFRPKRRDRAYVADADNSDEEDEESAEDSPEVTAIREVQAPNLPNVTSGTPVTREGLADESFEHHVAKEKEKVAKAREKELKAQARVAKSKER